MLSQQLSQHDIELSFTTDASDRGLPNNPHAAGDNTVSPVVILDVSAKHWCSLIGRIPTSKPAVGETSHHHHHLFRQLACPNSETIPDQLGYGLRFIAEVPYERDSQTQAQLHIETGSQRAVSLGHPRSLVRVYRVAHRYGLWTKV